VPEPFPAGAAPRPAPEPPIPLPPGRLVHAPGVGELFVRDTGGSGPPVLLLHGWMFPSDLNWLATYGPLSRAGYRVLAMDLRGHGRGLRSSEPFRLADCADDAAALLAALDVPQALVVGYSMGGPVAQLLASRSPDRVAGLVLCATALAWDGPYLKTAWNTMGGLRLLLGAFPQGVWRGLLKAGGGPADRREWVAAELSRGSARDLAEAGRELGRFDSSGWAGDLVPPSAVVLTARDRLVRPRRQYELAEALGAPVFRVEGDHDACSTRPREFTTALIAALRSVRSEATRGDTLAPGRPSSG
jgi:3-oxoadipate enol-lactonase